jgi:hypothetical protein
VGGFRNDEDLVVIDINLRHLLGVQSVLDRKRVQVEGRLK